MVWRGELEGFGEFSPESPVDETLIELSCQIANMCSKSLQSILSSETFKSHAVKHLNHA